MTTNCSTDPCGGAPLNAHCVKFTSQVLACIGSGINDRLDDILINIDTKLCELEGVNDDHIFDVLCDSLLDTLTIDLTCDTGSSKISADLIVGEGDDSLDRIMFWSGTEVKTRTIEDIIPDIQDAFGLLFQDTPTIDFTYDTLLRILTADVNISTDPNNAIQARADGVWAPQLVQNGLVYGGQVTWTGIDYIYDIAAAGYYINFVFYESPAVTVTLDPADVTYNRLDTFIVDNTGVASVLTGIASAIPVEPALDLGTQLRLGVALIQANTTQPLTDQCIYQEGVEWTVMSASATFDSGSVSNPCFGTMSIEATDPQTSDNILFQVLPFVAFPPAIYGTLSFVIRSKGTWDGGAIQLQFENATVAVGDAVVLSSGIYGFNDEDIVTCQQINIPINSFNLTAGDMVDSFRITSTVIGGDFGFFIDNLCLSVEQVGSSSVNVYAFQSGIRQTPGTNIVEFGTNPLLHNTTLDTNSFVQTFSGATVYNYPYQFVGRQSFENGTGITSFLHKGSLDPLAADFVNNVRLGINYTGNIYNAITDLNGYFGPDDIGYWMGVNGQGHGSFGVYTDDSTSKTGGIFWHTLDSASTDMVSIFGKQPSTINGAIGINAGGTGFLDYKIATFKTDKQWQGHGYGVGTFVDPSPTYNAAWDANGNLVEQVIDCPVGIISGGLVTWVSDLIFEIEPTVYYIDCVRYEILVPTQITLDPSDSTDPRIDVLALSSAGFIKITGVAAADPESPQTDGDDIFLTHVLINANAVVPADVTSETIYDENVEWTHTTTNLTANFAASTNVVHLTKDIDISTFINGGYIEFTSLTGTFDLTSWAALRLYYRNKTSGSPRLQFTWYSGATQKTQAFVYNPTNNTAASQSIVIPISSFSFLTNSTVDRLRITFGPLIIPAYIDWIQLQQGLVIAGAPAVNITANNGLTMSTTTNVQLGGLVGSPSTLLHDSYIDAGAFGLKINTVTAAINPLSVSSTTGSALVATSTSGDTINATASAGVAGRFSGTSYGVYSDCSLAGGVGVRGNSMSSSGSGAGILGYIQSPSGNAIAGLSFTTDTASILTNLSLVRNLLSGTAANGIGQKIQFTGATTVSSQVVNEIISKWVDATSATRTSQLDIVGVGTAATATIMSAHGSGVVGIGIASTPYNSTRLDVVDNSVGAASIVNISSTSTAAATNLQKALNIQLSGTNATSAQRTYGIYSSNTHAGTTSQNYGGYFSSTNGVSANYGVWGDAVGTVGVGVYGNTDSGWGVVGAASTSGIAVQANATSGTGLSANATTGLGAQFIIIPTTTNNNATVVKIQRHSSGSAANSISGSLDFYVQDSSGAGMLTNQLISKWTDVTSLTRTSEFSLKGVNSAVTNTLVTVSGGGFMEVTTNGSTTSAFRANAQSGGVAITGQSGSVGGWFTGTSYGMEGGSGSGIPVLATNFGLGTTSQPQIQLQNSINTPTIGDLVWMKFSTRITGGTTTALMGILGYRMLNVTSGSTSDEFFINVNTGTDTGHAEAVAWGSPGYMRMRHITATEASAITPAEGMMVFVSDTNGTFTSIGFWGYQNGAWHAF